jgi:hypothetical protein
MKIVAMTFFKVFARSGINAGEGKTMDEFLGTEKDWGH